MKRLGWAAGIALLLLLLTLFTVIKLRLLAKAVIIDIALLEKPLYLVSEMNTLMLTGTLNRFAADDMEVCSLVWSVRVQCGAGAARCRYAPPLQLFPSPPRQHRHPGRPGPGLRGGAHPVLLAGGAE